MKRRTFIAATLASTLMPFSAYAAEFIDYTPGVVQEALDEGKTVFVDYSATWCSTCARQERVISGLRDEDSKYDDAMTFIKVDWDTYKDHDITLFNSIPRRSTLIVLRGEKELGRVVAGTSVAQIKALMDTGL